MRDTKLDYQTWAMAIYILNVESKGASSMKNHRVLDLRQKMAGDLVHRIRESRNIDLTQFIRPVEVDETYIGVKEKNKYQYKKLNAGLGTAGKTAVVGVKDRETKQVQTQVVTDTIAATLTSFVYSTSDTETQVYTDDAKPYQRYGVVLVTTQTRLLWNLSQDVTKAPTAL